MIIAQYGKFMPGSLRQFESVEEIDNAYGFQYIVCYWKITKWNPSYNSLPRSPKKTNYRVEISTIYVL